MAEIKLRRRKLNDGTTSLFLATWQGGKWCYEFLGLRLRGKNRDEDKTTLLQAEAIRAQRQLDSQADEHGLARPSKTRGDFLAFFEANITGDSARTAYRQLRKCHGDKPLPFAAANEAFFQGFVEFLEKQDLKPNSKRHYYRKVRTIVHLAVKKELFRKDPMRNTEAPKGEDVERAYLEIDELERLAAVVSPWPETQRAFLFACATGLRYSDVRALTWDRVKGNRLEIRIQKTKRVEYLPLSPQALDILRDGLEDNVLPITGPVFNLKLSNTGPANERLRKMAKMAGIKKHISFHCARHTFAILALQAGIPITSVSKMLGHSSLAMTQIYAKVTDKLKEEAAAKMPMFSLGRKRG